MVEDTNIEDIPQDTTTPETTVVPTEDELKAKMNEALKVGDFKVIAKVATEIAKLLKASEQAELDAKIAVLAAVTTKVKSAVMKAITPIINSGELDAADGIWFSYDFGDKQESCRLMKGTAKKSGGSTGGGGTGKKFDVTTAALLEQFGNEDYKDGMTFSQAHESSTDGNFRYNIRQKLLKKGGYIQ